MAIGKYRFLVRSVRDLSSINRRSNKVNLLASTVNQLPSGVLKTFKTEILKPVKKAVLAQIDSQGARSGQRYKPLNPNYKKPSNSKILVNTGNMLKRLTKNEAYEVSSDSTTLVVRLADKIALHHQLGTKKLSQRKILRLTKPDREEIKSTLNRIIRASLTTRRIV